MRGEVRTRGGRGALEFGVVCGRLVGMPPQPYVFISYSHAGPDAEYVDRLAAQLTAAGVPVWYDRHLGSGDRWDSDLRARVDACAALVVVMSPAAEASP